MKKIMTLILFGLVSILVACQEVVITSISIDPQPRSTLYIGEDLDPFDLIIHYSDGSTQVISWPENEDIKVNGFNTSTVSTNNTYTISYMGQSLIVTYSVIDKVVPLFGGGSGELGDPYIIQTAQHFSNIRLFPSKEYLLVEDIDLSSVSWSTIDSFSGKLQGNGHTISNINVTSLFTTIKGTVSKPASIHNLKVVAAIDDKRINQICSTIAYQAENALFDGITIDGTIKGANVAGLVSIIRSNTVFKDCINRANLIADSTLTSENAPSFLGIFVQYMGGFVGIVVQGSTGVKFENVSNHGNLTGTYKTNVSTTAGQLIAQVQTQEDKLVQIQIVNCNGYGKIVGNTTVSEGHGDFYGKKYDIDGKIIQEEKNHGHTTDSSKFIGFVINYQLADINDPTNEYQMQLRADFGEVLRLLEAEHKTFYKVKRFYSGTRYVAYDKDTMTFIFTTTKANEIDPSPTEVHIRVPLSDYLYKILNINKAQIDIQCTFSDQDQANVVTVDNTRLRICLYYKEQKLGYFMIFNVNTNKNLDISEGNGFTFVD